jgi:chemotaxis protein methyltransferase CheR
MTAAVSLEYLRGVVFAESAIVLDDSKDYLLESRLAPVAKEAGLDGIDALAVKLRSGTDARLKTRVVEALTTNETYFFRDQHPFDTLKKTLLPELMTARKAERRLRIWCAAASTGQEPYSLAMTLRETIPDLSSWKLEILATDINRTVLDAAKAGVYRQHEVNRGLPAAMLVKYFERDGQNWRINASIRGMVEYKQLNLLDPWPFAGPFDFVFMRNVLIYFDVPTKQRLLDRARRVMPKDGVLFLGGAETTVRLHEGYRPARDDRTVYYRLSP